MLSVQGAHDTCLCGQLGELESKVFGRNGAVSTEDKGIMPVSAPPVEQASPGGEALKLSGFPKIATNCLRLRIASSVEGTANLQNEVDHEGVILYAWSGLHSRA